jgi:predicted house-cleaning noncanonical NTP pyrophosphatase (MazG superfamily)
MMNERFYELAAQIAAWHEQTFPDATEESQILKLNEEFGEYADGEFIEELADVFIVAASLSERWGNMMGTFTMKAVVKHAGKDADLLMRKICEKMDVNAARVWKKLPDGRYKHVEGIKK